MGGTGSPQRRSARARLVPRSPERTSIPRRPLLVPHRLSQVRRRSTGETGMGAVPPPSPDRSRRGVASERESCLSRNGGASPPLLVASQSACIRRELGERYRDRDPSDFVGLGASTP